METVNTNEHFEVTHAADSIDRRINDADRMWYLMAAKMYLDTAEGIKSDIHLTQRKLIHQKDNLAKQKDTRDDLIHRIANNFKFAAYGTAFFVVLSIAAHIGNFNVFKIPAEICIMLIYVLIMLATAWGNFQKYLHKLEVIDEIETAINDLIKRLERDREGEDSIEPDSYMGVVFAQTPFAKYAETHNDTYKCVHFCMTHANEPRFASSTISEMIDAYTASVTDVLNANNANNVRGVGRSDI